MAQLPVIRVVAAEIERDGRYLITQRRPEATLPLLWEFPGGKVEPGETDEEALARELREEMDLEVEVGAHVMGVRQAYEEYVVDFHVYSVRLLSDRIRKVYINDYRWVTLDELSAYEFPPVDQESIALLLRGR